MRNPWIGTLIAVCFTVLTVPAWVSLLGAPEHAPHRVPATVLALTYAVATIAAALLTGTGGPPALRVVWRSGPSPRWEQSSSHCSVSGVLRCWRGPSA